ncbi:MULTISPECIES: acetate/propionate family kinase [Halomonadaceae]|mgnify:CR=1 FL=1|uniref:Acetate kinase n=1 Tax=Modicisalibacter zincidurans TaxID=1178777 RepID=A0ABP9RJP6_9GAMM|nr:MULTISPECIES: acetate/propionate family kinase [Halomonas]MCD6007055.1 acetate/propionate family kinase [Halomonas sp. IOP_31]
MSSPILTINAGSSSLKFALYDQGRQRLRGLVERIHEAPRLSLHEEAAGTEGFTVEGTGHAAVAHALLDWLEGHVGQASFAAVGHRVVHGGRTHDQARRVDAALLDELDELVPLAPLHQPQALAIIRQIHEHWPDLPQVACFDTAFHRTQPWLNQCYALPRQLTDEGIQRYGFHGLSYAHVARQLPDLLGERAQGRVLVAHLGHGCSMCAIRDGRSLATSMGFTALEGLMMGRRAGSLDPGVVLYLLQGKRWNAEQIERMLYHDSGLYGVSGGISDDMRDLLDSPDAQAQEAVALFVRRAVREAGALIALLGGLDALVFTAGIGEKAAAVRRAICAELGWLGIALDDTANAHHARRLDTGRGPRVCVVTADEEAEIHHSVSECLAIAGD